MGKVCRTCEWRPARAKGECPTCWAYRRRTGQTRPEDLIVAHGQRIEGQLDRRR